MDDTHGLPKSGGGAARRFRARVVSGPDAGRSARLDRALLVGTSELCDLRLSDRTVSRRHCTLEPLEQRVRVRDEQSKNGIWLGDTRVIEVELPLDGEIRLGETMLRIDLDRFAASREANRDAGRDAGRDADRDADKDASKDASKGSDKDTLEAPGLAAFGRFIGSSPKLAPMFRTLDLAAKTDSTVLLEGESGTGKELLAEAIHERSGRANAPFVVVDLGAIPETLIESELFGHERGAFTGADRARVGAFEEAHGGTIFLDEIGELPLNLQSRLLGVLERRQFRRIGGDAVIDVDVRVIAATNRNLEREVEESRFRLDLFHRLAVFLVRIPPLRERPEDIEPLALSFLRQMVRRGSEVQLSKETVARLGRQEWRGNVRELRNHIERLALLGEGAALVADAPAHTEQAPKPATDAEEILQAASSGYPYRQARAAAIEAFTRLYVEEMLARHGGNVSKAAQAAGVARRHFHRLKKTSD